MEEELNDEVGTLLDQLQAVSIKAEKVKEERDPLRKEDLEDFVIQRGGALVEDALDMVATMRDFIVSAPNAEDVGAYADLIKATSTALEALNRLAVTDKKSETSVKLKEMDIASRKELQQSDNTQRLLTTREEIFKMLIDKAKPIEGEIVESKVV